MTTTGQAVRAVDKPTINTISQNDTLFVGANGIFVQANSATVFSNTTISIGTLTLVNGNTPMNSTPNNVTKGTFWFDSNYIYVAVANNSLKRVNLTAF